jgi:hypothetical protein
LPTGLRAHHSLSENENDAKQKKAEQKNNMQVAKTTSLAANLALNSLIEASVTSRCSAWSLQHHKKHG